MLMGAIPLVRRMQGQRDVSFLPYTWMENLVWGWNCWYEF